MHTLVRKLSTYAFFNRASYLRRFLCCLTYKNCSKCKVIVSCLQKKNVVRHIRLLILYLIYRKCRQPNSNLQFPRPSLHSGSVEIIFHLILWERTRSCSIRCTRSDISWFNREKRELQPSDPLRGTPHYFYLELEPATAPQNLVHALNVTMVCFVLSSMKSDLFYKRREQVSFEQTWDNAVELESASRTNRMDLSIFDSVARNFYSQRWNIDSWKVWKPKRWFSHTEYSNFKGS